MMRSPHKSGRSGFVAVTLKILLDPKILGKVGTGVFWCCESDRVGETEPLSD